MHLLILLPTLLLLTAGSAEGNEEACSSVLSVSQDIREEAAAIREQAQGIREEGYSALQQAYDSKEDAFRLQESALESRSGLEAILVEAFGLIRTQTTGTGLYVQEIRASLSSLVERVGRMELRSAHAQDKLEEKIEGIDESMGNKLREIEEKLETRFGEVDEKLETRFGEMEERMRVDGDFLKGDVSSSLQITGLLSSRLSAWISEIRLISLYKMADENNRNGDSKYQTEIATDGLFMFSLMQPGSMATHTHTRTADPDNKIWVDLGGLFRVYKVMIWSYRDCCLERIVGTHVYADATLLGTVIKADHTFEFPVAEGQAVYARRVLLHQPLPQHLHVLEIQVWGNGPYNEDDMFA